jgi:hypothetical protein
MTRICATPVPRRPVVRKLLFVGLDVVALDLAATGHQVREKLSGTDCSTARHAVGEFANVRVVHSVKDLLLQLGGEADTRTALLCLAVVHVGEHSHLALCSVGWNLESTWILGINPWLGSGHGVVLIWRHDHTKMTALSALRGANGHRANGLGVLAELLARICNRGEVGLAGDLGERVSRESKGGRGRSHRHVGG